VSSNKPYGKAVEEETMALRIHQLQLGTIKMDKSVFTTLRNFGQTLEVPVIMWYIEGAEARILVDTAAPPPAEAPKTIPPYEQPPEMRCTTALSSLGLKPEDIDIVVLTHLHWDHCTNAGLFPKARFVVQREELRYAAAPLPIHWRAYGGRPGGTLAYLPRDAQLQVVEGDVPLVKGVSLYHLPGHTPGMQGVVVETDGGRYLIASDNVPLYDNWDGEGPTLPHIPNTLHVNLEDYFASFAKMERVADVVLPSHDFRVLEKGVLPSRLLEA
jgi:glyoxylase-like metal-dependent hydrolase (beta-lactamase superfamily II)